MPDPSSTPVSPFAEEQRPFLEASLPALLQLIETPDHVPARWRSLPTAMPVPWR